MRRELWAVNSDTFAGATQGFSNAFTVMHPTRHANQRYSKQESVYAHTRGCHLFHKHHWERQCCPLKITTICCYLSPIGVKLRAMSVRGEERMQFILLFPLLELRMKEADTEREKAGCSRFKGIGIHPKENQRESQKGRRGSWNRKNENENRERYKFSSRIFLIFRSFL